MVIPERKAYWCKWIPLHKPNISHTDTVILITDNQPDELKTYESSYTTRLFQLE
jgi:hypothetical protein